MRRAITLSTLFRSKKYKHRLWQTKEEQKTKWTEIEAVKKTAAYLDKIINPKVTGSKPIWSAEAKRSLLYSCAVVQLCAVAVNLIFPMDNGQWTMDNVIDALMSLLDTGLICTDCAVN